MSWWEKLNENDLRGLDVLGPSLWMMKRPRDPRSIWRGGGCPKAGPRGRWSGSSLARAGARAVVGGARGVALLGRSVGELVEADRIAGAGAAERGAQHGVADARAAKIEEPDGEGAEVDVAPDR